MFDFLNNIIESLKSAAQAFVQGLWDLIPDKTDAVNNAADAIAASGIWAWVRYTFTLIDYVVPVELVIAFALVPLAARFALATTRTLAWAWERLPFN